MSKTVSQRVDEQQSKLLYRDTIHLDFDPVKHTYYINGELAFGVTTALGIIAKPYLVYWAANMAGDYVKANLVPGQQLDEIEIQTLVDGAKKAHNSRKEGAGAAGTYIHNWIEAFVRGEKPAFPYNARLKEVCQDFISFWKEHKPVVVAAEQMLCSPKYNLAGTPDMICRVNGKLTIMDWKTGSGIYPEMFMQMAAYAIMYEEEHPEQKVEQLWVVNASISNMFQDECRTEVAQFKRGYVSALQLYKENQKVEALFKKGK